MVVKKCATTKCNNFKRVACILLPCLFTKNVLHNTQKSFIYPHESKFGCIGNLLGKYAIYGLSHSAPRFDLEIFMDPKYKFVHPTQQQYFWQ